MTEAEQKDFTVAVFSALVGEKQDRLARGAILRQAMHDTLARGEEPKGYRPDWITEQSRGLVNFLVDAGEKFNLEHPDDQISVSDLLDVLATTAGLFRKKVRD